MNKEHIGDFINLLGIRKRALLLRSNGDSIFLEEITEEEEKQIDNINNKSMFIIYGEVNLNNDDDLFTLIEQNIVDDRGLSVIHKGFDYEKGGAFIDPNEGVKIGPTSDPIAWFKYNHCLIGKPKRIKIYKE